MRALHIRYVLYLFTKLVNVIIFPISSAQCEAALQVRLDSEPLTCGHVAQGGYDNECLNTAAFSLLPDVLHLSS